MSDRFQLTASRRGMVHLIQEGRCRTLCGVHANYSNGVLWPRWSPNDRGLDPIHRQNCTKCAITAQALKRTTTP